VHVNISSRIISYRCASEMSYSVNLPDAVMLGVAYDRGGASPWSVRSLDLLPWAIRLQQQQRFRPFVLKVAQRIERWTCDQQVVGSNPTRGN